MSSSKSNFVYLDIVFYYHLKCNFFGTLPLLDSLKCKNLKVLMSVQIFRYIGLPAMTFWVDKLRSNTEER